MQPLGRACVINQDKALKREQAQAVDGVLRNKQTLATSQLIAYEKNVPFFAGAFGARRDQKLGG